MEAAQEAETLVPQFQLETLLNQDQGGRRVTLLGKIKLQPALLLAERAAFHTASQALQSFSSNLTTIQDLGANDIYHWYLASSSPSSASPDCKLTLIYPCTEQHVKKYSQQGVRMVTETPKIYTDHVRPYMQRKREEGRLNWVFNILEGRAEQEDVLYREHGEEGFLVSPDLNWDRKTMTSLHLLGLVERRDIWSLRDLRKSHITWLKHMREKFLDATISLYPDLAKDQLKLYMHYQPTYYHFHVHIVHVALEAGSTQATGKAFGFENLISQLETIKGGQEAGMADVSLTYFLGEANELWTEIFQPLKEGQTASGG
ncbi:MAG: hypothetical protein M1827_002316 [Pycnora praestabilis]|nr:MAG: hypothetical protein M1827_002316 [Pycnora praestabilis]